MLIVTRDAVRMEIVIPGNEDENKYRMKSIGCVLVIRLVLLCRDESSSGPLWDATETWLTPGAVAFQTWHMVATACAVKRGLTGLGGLQEEQSRSTITALLLSHCWFKMHLYLHRTKI